MGVILVVGTGWVRVGLGLRWVNVMVNFCCTGLTIQEREGGVEGGKKTKGGVIVTWGSSFLFFCFCSSSLLVS